MVLSSVAAERPRRANAVYGASKAGLDALAQGLGDDLHDDGVRVLVGAPGLRAHADDARPRPGAARVPRRGGRDGGARTGSTGARRRCGRRARCAG